MLHLLVSSFRFVVDSICALKIKYKHITTIRFQVEDAVSNALCDIRYAYAGNRSEIHLNSIDTISVWGFRNPIKTKCRGRP